MKIIEDLHLHTHISKDSLQSGEDYLLEGIKRGIEYIGFSDHLDLDPVDKDYEYYNYKNSLNDYVHLNEKYGKKINFLFGLEVTYQSTLENSIKENIEGKPYDYLIGSVHRLEGLTIAGTSGIPFFRGKDEKTSYIMYFEEMAKLVQMNYFQIIGHFDVIKRFGVQFYGKFHAEKYKTIIKNILKKAVEQGTIIEINSSGYRQPPEEPYPSKEILEMYRDSGGTEITIGSDAHNIKQFGMGLNNALKYAKSVFDFEIVTFKQKKKIKLGKISEYEEIILTK
jgi:histidinol-phosphatase (PHP family)